MLAVCAEGSVQTQQAWHVGAACGTACCAAGQATLPLNMPAANAAAARMRSSAGSAGAPPLAAAAAATDGRGCRRHCCSCATCRALTAADLKHRARVPAIWGASTATGPQERARAFGTTLSADMATRQSASAFEHS